MTLLLVTRTLFDCTCRHCRYHWTTERKPKRCANPACKSYTWHEDRRQRPDPSRIENGTPPPQVPLKETVRVLGSAATILDQVIQDLGPCDHGKGNCLCQEAEVLARIHKQIAALKPFTGGKG